MIWKRREFENFPGTLPRPLFSSPAVIRNRMKVIGLQGKGISNLLKGELKDSMLKCR